MPRATILCSTTLRASISPFGPGTSFGSSFSQADGGPVRGSSPARSSRAILSFASTIFSTGVGRGLEGGCQHEHSVSDIPGGLNMVGIPVCAYWRLCRAASRNGRVLLRLLLGGELRRVAPLHDHVQDPREDLMLTQKSGLRFRTLLRRNKRHLMPPRLKTHTSNLSEISP